MNEKPLEIGSEPTVADTFIGQYGSVVLVTSFSSGWGDDI